MKVHKVKRIEQEHIVEIDATDIINGLRLTRPELFDVGDLSLRPTAEVVFQVPGGGDWSNCFVAIDDVNPIRVTLMFVKLEDLE